MGLSFGFSMPALAAARGQGVSFAARAASVLAGLEPEANPRIGGPATLNAPLRLSVGTSSAPDAPDADLTDLYLYETLGAAFPASFFGGGELIHTATSPDQRKFPAVSVFSDGTSGNLGDGTEAVDWRVAFTTDADRVAFRVDSSGTVLDRYRFILDGAYLSEAEPDAVSGGRRWLVLDLGAGQHEVAIEGFGDVPFIGLSLPVGASISPLPAGPRGIVFGDSFTSGTGADHQADGYVRVMGDTLGLRDLWASGLGSTGYIATAGGTKYTIGERVLADLARAEAVRPVDLIFVAAGINDFGQGDVTTAAASVLDALRATSPKALILVLGAWNTAAPSAGSADWQAVATQLQAVVAGRPGVAFIDTEAVAFTKSDATHPDTAGHAAIGAWLADAVTTALETQFGLAQHQQAQDPFAVQKMALASILEPSANPRVGGPGVLNAPLRLSVGTSSAPAAPDTDLTDLYLYETLGAGMGVSFFGGGEYVYTAASPDQRKFPVASVFSDGTSGNLNNGTEAVDWRVAFTTDADRVAFRVDAGGTVLDRYRFIVNGAYLDEAEPAAVNGGRRWLVLDLGAGTHEVAIESFGDRPFIGFSVPAGSSVSPIGAGPRALVLGDSFVSGTGAANQADTMARVFGDTLGIRDLWASGLDGTGYIADVGGTRYTLGARAAADIARAGVVDLVLISAGNSDFGLGNVTAPAETLLDTLRTNCPGALIFVALPWNTVAPTPGETAWQTAKAQLQAAVAGRDGVYLLDTESVAYTKADGTHPDTAGHATIGEWLAAQVLAELTA